MRHFIKFALLIILGIIVGASYKIPTLMGCSSSSSLDYNEPDWINTAEILLTIEKIEYYEFPFQKGQYYFFIETKYKGTFTSSGNDDIVKALNIASTLNRKLTPQKASTFPLWLAAIFALIIILFPKLKKNKSYNNDNINNYKKPTKNENDLKRYINKK